MSPRKVVLRRNLLGSRLTLRQSYLAPSNPLTPSWRRVSLPIKTGHSKRMDEGGGSAQRDKSERREDVDKCGLGHECKPGPNSASDVSILGHCDSRPSRQCHFCSVVVQAQVYCPNRYCMRHRITLGRMARGPSMRILDYRLLASRDVPEAHFQTATTQRRRDTSGSSVSMNIGRGCVDEDIPVCRPTAEEHRVGG